MAAAAPAAPLSLGNVLRSGVGVPIGVLAVMAMIILPLPPIALDVLFTFNIALSLVVVMAVFYVSRPLEFGVFPTVLLLATLLRLALNVASTRVVLLHGHTGSHAAGKVIESFGEFVIGGNYAVGVIVFMILTIINFVVVTKVNVDAYGSEAPVTPTIFELLRKEHRLPPEEAWVIATNKSFGLMGGSKLRDFGDPFSANVILPKQLLIETIKSAVSTNAGPGVEDRQALAEQMMMALDEGYEGFGWRVFESGRALGKDLKATLAKSLLDYFNDPTVPTSGDELTFFMTKEIMNRLAPSLLVVNFWDIDIAHYGAFSLYLEAIRRTDRLVHELWQHVQSLPAYRDRTTLLVVPELGRDSDIAGNGFANHRSGDDSCRRVWLVALGAGVPKGAGTDRLIRTFDVAPTVAQILGFKMPECEGRPLGELAF